MHVKSNDVSTKFNIHQSAFCIDFFDAEMKIPETSLQALSSLPLPAPIPKRACSQASVKDPVPVKLNFVQLLFTSLSVQHVLLVMLVKPAATSQCIFMSI